MAMGGMGMRITTNAMIRRYSTNLNNALGDLDSKRNTVATNRNFNKIAEDPAAAMKSFKLRSNFQRTEVQKANTLDSLAKLEEVTSNVQGCTRMGRTFIEKSLLSYSDPNSAFESRQAYKQEVDQLIESFLQQANGKYNENFIFGGASTKDLPFEKLESGEILYRGVPVNTPNYLTKDDVSKILSDVFKLKDAVVATNPDVKTTLGDTTTGLMQGGTPGTPASGNTPAKPATIDAKTLLDNITNDANLNTIPAGSKSYEAMLKENDVFQLTGLDVKVMLSSIGLNDLPKPSGNDTFDSLVSNPTLSEAYENIMGTDYADDSKTISYDDLIAKINNYSLGDVTVPRIDTNTGGYVMNPDGTCATDTITDLESKLQTKVNDSLQNITLTEDEVKEMLTNVGLRDEELGKDINGQDVTPQNPDNDDPPHNTPLTNLLNKIMENDKGVPPYVKDQLSYDEVEKAIDTAVKENYLTESQGYQLKANEQIGYQLKYTTYFNEHSYRDIGFGMKEKSGEIVSTSAFDTAVNGLDVFGYGIDEDGLPNNIIALAQELSKTLEVDDISEFDFEKHNKIINKMRASYDDMVDNGLAAIGTKCAFLENTEDQLTEASQILNEQISDLDFCDPAEAITNLMWAQYAYNATLKVGNTLLSNSFIDFMS